MMRARIKQGITYIFGRYRESWNCEVKEILTEGEFKIFLQMERYDKIHSYNLLKMVERDSILKDDIEFKKLALLHDCGKESVGLIRRIKKVLLGDKKLSNHAELGNLKMRDINKELASLIKNHHIKTSEIKMKRFQELDDR